MSTAVTSSFHSSTNRIGNTVRTTPIQLWALLALLVYMPLPLASNRPWALAVLGILLSTLLIWQLWMAADAPGKISLNPLQKVTGIDGWRRAKVPMILMGLWIVLLALQMLPMPFVWMTVLDGNPADGFPVQNGYWSTLSVDGFSTRIYFAKACVFMGVLWLLFSLIRTHNQVELLAKTIVFSGFLQAIAGVLLFTAGAHYSLFFVSIEHTKGLGTFVYHNHFAGYMEMTLSVGIGLMIAKLDGDHSKNWKQRAHSWLSLLMGEKVLLRIILIIMVIGLIASHSRMGNSAFFISLLGVGVIAIAFSKKATHSTILFIASLIVLDVVIIGGVVGIEKVVQRIEATNLLSNAEQPLLSVSGSVAGDVVMKPAEQRSKNVASATEESVEERIGPGLHSLDIVKDFPLLGTGGGTFHLAFFPYRPAEVHGYFDHAHNDFFEFAVETGLIGMLLLVGMVLHSVVCSVRILVKRRNQFARGMAFASLMGVTTMLIHSAVDFNLQNTTNGMLFLIVMSLPYMVDGREQARRVEGASNDLNKL